jgi:hypothetical protein
MHGFNMPEALLNSTHSSCNARRHHTMIANNDSDTSNLLVITAAALTVQVHVRLDTTLQQDKLPCQAFVSRSLALGANTLGMEFVEVPCDVQYADVERVGGEAAEGLRFNEKFLKGRASIGVWSQLLSQKPEVIAHTCLY